MKKQTYCNPCIYLGATVEPLTADEIIEKCIEFLCVSRDDLYGTNKGKRSVCEARFMIFNILRSNTSLSLEAIGGLFNRDHATVMYGIKKTKDLCWFDYSFRSQFSKLNHFISLR